MLRQALLVLAGALLISTAPGGAAGIPSAAPAGKLARTPVKIAAGALTSADLNSAKVTEQGYVHDAVALARYERDFDAVKYGRSRFSYVESTVMLYGSTLDASLALAGIQAGFNPTSSSLDAWASTFSRSTGVSPSSVSIRRKKTFTLADTRGSELILRLVTPVGRMDGGYVFMQTGKLVGMLVTLSSPGSSIEHADLARLYGAFAKRMRAETKRLA